MASMPPENKTTAPDPSFPRYNRHLNPKAGHKALSRGDHGELLKSAVFTLTHNADKEKNELFNPKKYQTVSHTNIREVHLPVNEEVKVPVVRKEVLKGMERKTVKGTKLVPVTKYRDVKETKLEVRTEMVNGQKEKRYVPVSRVRQVPYTDYEEKEVEVSVNVPVEKVMTRKGHRVDKYVGTKVMAVEEDCVYELRPVLISKGEPRVAEHQNTYLHHGKRSHGDPIWSDDMVEGWEGRPETPVFQTSHRPFSASSRLSRAGSDVTTRSLRPVSSLGALPARNEPRPGTGR